MLDTFLKALRKVLLTISS